MRILWVSDAAWSQSGYANQTRLAAPRLAALGHDVALVASYGLQGGAMGWEGLKVYPGGADPFGNDVIGRHARDWQADVVITLKDIGVFNPEAFNGLRWCPLCPVDHEPVPPAVHQRIGAAYRPIAYAPNGMRAMRDIGYDPLYAPHAYDPAVYAPLPREEARRALGLPDDLFIVSTVAVNRGAEISRKAWQQNLEAFALFAQDKPHARYLLHTDMADDGYEGGFPLRAIAQNLGIMDKILPSEQGRYRAGGFDEPYLRALYCASNVVNCVSVGEGFGIPTLEAQACGVPVITGGWAASEDLNFGGWEVAREDALKLYDRQLAHVYIPLPEAVAGCLRDAYAALASPRRAAHHRREALSGAQDYQIDTVIEEYWRPALDALAAQIGMEHRRGVARIVRPEEILSAA
jgi:glycosyltransferase involved in cell wall biosynthesis